MRDIEEITEKLPKIDCGSCGAPTCMAFAEDIVKGETTADECTVIMRKLFHKYLEENKNSSLLGELKKFPPNGNSNGEKKKETNTDENNREIK